MNYDKLNNQGHQSSISSCGKLAIWCQLLGSINLLGADIQAPSIQLSLTKLFRIYYQYVGNFMLLEFNSSTPLCTASVAKNRLEGQQNQHITCIMGGSVIP